MENALAQTQLEVHTPDIVIEIPRDACNFYEFYRAKEMIDIGRRRTEAALSRYMTNNAQDIQSNRHPRR